MGTGDEGNSGISGGMKVNTFFIIGGCVLFVVYSIALLLGGMAVATKYNRQAWDKFYEGRRSDV